MVQEGQPVSLRSDQHTQTDHSHPIHTQKNSLSLQEAKMDFQQKLKSISRDDHWWITPSMPGVIEQNAIAAFQAANNFSPQERTTVFQQLMNEIQLPAHHGIKLSIESIQSETQRASAGTSYILLSVDTQETGAFHTIIAPVESVPLADPKRIKPRIAVVTEQQYQSLHGENPPDIEAIFEQSHPYVPLSRNSMIGVLPALEQIAVLPTEVVDLEQRHFNSVRLAPAEQYKLSYLTSHLAEVLPRVNQDGLAMIINDNLSLVQNS